MKSHINTAYEYGVYKALSDAGYASLESFEKDAAHYSTALGAVPSVGPLLSGLEAGYSDDSARTGIGTGVGSWLGQLGGGIAGGLAGGLASLLARNPELTPLLTGLGVTGGMALGGGFGASAGRKHAD